MNVKNLAKSYALYGLTEALLNYAEPADFRHLKALERELALRIVDDEKSDEVFSEAEWAKTKIRVGVITRASNYLDCYLTEAQRAHRPKGVILTPPPSVGFYVWHRSKLTNARRIVFDYAIKNAHRQIAEDAKHGTSSPTAQAVAETGDAWRAEIDAIIRKCRERRDIAELSNQEQKNTQVISGTRYGRI